MGTRADFYVGRGLNAEWLGSVAYDGHPSRYPRILRARTEEEFRAAVAAMLKKQDDATLPPRGWPWPWNNSGTSDYGYCFLKVQEDDMGPYPGVAEELPGQHVWWERGYDDEGRPQTAYWINERGDADTSEAVAWPNMAARKNVRLDEGSGMLFLASGSRSR